MQADKTKKEVKRRIHAALIDTNGSLPDAAKALGMAVKQVYAAIHNDRDLKLRWATSSDEIRQPSEAVKLHRPVIECPVEEPARLHSVEPTSRSPARNNDEDATEAILAHYDRVGLSAGWTRDRFYRFCKMLHMTVEEVLAICQYDGRGMAQFRKWLRANYIPPHAALALTLFEDAYFFAQCGFERALPLVPIHLFHSQPTTERSC